MELIADFAKILLPAGLVLYAMYLTVRAFTQKELKKTALEIQLKSKETVLPVRLQAYERLTLLLERISPGNLLVRLHDNSLPAKAFQQVLLADIREEFNHNLSQQLYISEDVWEMVKNVREDLVMMINGAADTLPAEAMAIDLSRTILEAYSNREVDPVAFALSHLKAEIQESF